MNRPFTHRLAGVAPSPVAAPVTPLPDCTECVRTIYCCTCHVAEPDVMPVEDMMRVMPGFFERPRDGSIWLASEEAAVRSAFGMSK